MAAVTELKDLSRLGERDSIARVVAALEEAAAGRPGDEEVAGLDRVLIEAIAMSRHRDAILGHIALSRFGDLIDRCADRCGGSGGQGGTSPREATWRALDLVRRPAVLRRINEAGSVKEWAERILRAVEASHLTFGPLFRQRSETYASRVLFELPERGSAASLSWSQVAARVERLARALLSLDHPHEPQRIALLSENRLEMALLDLACLTSGLVNVVVPANATDSDVGYILRHARIGTVIVSGREQLAKVVKNRQSLPELRRIVTMEPGDGADVSWTALRDLEKRADEIPISLVRERSLAVRIDDLATIMYTSGTTGTPKGIQYSHRNLVFKRFARALALPEIGDHDVFLCYLPLFHTFGRYLELQGCIFWGAKYCFLLDPSTEALQEGMSRYRPTVFISVPRRWIQLYEAIAQRADPMHAADEELRAATRERTGGRLQWGLSAAGHLDPEVFRFFHSQGVQVLSGFGMSEATGGITMTPPFKYKDDSLGVPLPGIEVRLEEDGELAIRGPYVMMGYLDPPDGEVSFDDEGWLHSGDLMRTDDEGHLRIVDRKKEIYKNIKGQTIAPQRIENLFREFESVGRAFLVGDGMEHNTLLIYPNFAYKELDLTALTHQELQDHFRSLVVSVNKFVAPFERVVDFAIIDRDLSAERGELTPKGTPRRKVVVENFGNVIDALYRRTKLRVGNVELALPNWLFQVLGLTARDVRVADDRLLLPPMATGLTVRRVGERRIQLGSCIYETGAKAVDLGAFLSTPRLWLGNEELVAFAPLDLDDRERPTNAARTIEWYACAEPHPGGQEDRDKLEAAAARTDWDLLDVDRAARMLGSTDGAGALGAVRLLERILAHDESNLSEAARFILARCAAAPSGEVRRRAFQVLAPVERPARFRHTVERFLARDPGVLEPETRAVLCERGMPEAKVDTLIELAWDLCCRDGAAGERSVAAQQLLQFLAEYGGAHPTTYRKVRAFLVRTSLFARDSEICRHADDARSTLQFGFWQWLGPTLRIAVDTETGQEYRWDDVVVVEEGTPDDHRRRLLSAIRNTPFLREAVFLLYQGRSIRLPDIPPGGIWIRRMDARHGKAVYHVTIQTRSQEAYDVAVNLNESMTVSQVQEEVDWLIVCGESKAREPVVEDFGGYAPEEDVWSEEFIPGDTLDRELRRLVRRPEREEGLEQLWPFLAWSALGSFVDFWVRTGRRLEIGPLSPRDIVLPTHDYHRGSRIVSLPPRRPHRGLLSMLRAFKHEFVDGVVRDYPQLEGLVGWDVLFSSVLEVLGEGEGLAVLREVLLADGGLRDPLLSALEQYVATVEARGFLPKRLYFAAKRYRRWAELNQDATAQARAATLKELYDTYGLDSLAGSHPEVRLRFFRETVFRDSSAALSQGLDGLIGRMRGGDLRDAELAGAVAELRQRIEVEQDADYFLARIPFAYLRPEDAVDFVTTDMGGEYQNEIVVTLEDADGEHFRVRHALLPKEVERLHRLFLAARLNVRFGPEHRYLLAISGRGQIIGGIYYTVEEGGETAHLEKIVVAERYRRKGVADGLMNQFFNRLKAAGARAVTTGFFRPEYFYGYGFRIERRYAGLVKELVSAEGSTPA